ncbi:MAG: T9SS type A sorting domain-containing protein [Flavobacteriales bacterium]|nr:T9SS type A sorting domain-containing protein [Flavobacteriales bacterium]
MICLAAGWKTSTRKLPLLRSMQARGPMGFIRFRWSTKVGTTYRTAGDAALTSKLMKKTFTLLSLLMVLSTSDSSAQNYQPINSHSLQVFYQENNFAQGEDYNMWGTRIDSVSTSSNGDTIYYNYPIVRDTIVEYELYDGSCAWWNAPNWNGYETRIDTNGNAYFRNSFGDSLLIRFSEQLSGSWEAYRFANGDSLVATITDITWVDDAWISDSVKTIEFIRYSTNGIVTDPMNHVTLEIYRSHGFRRMIDFVRFPVHDEPIYQVDPNSINVNSVPYRVGNEYRATPHVGDGYFEYSRLDYVSSPAYHGSSTSRLITDVSTNGQGQVVVYWQENSQSYSFDQVPSNISPYGYTYELHTSDVQIVTYSEIYTSNPDSSFKTLMRNYDDINMMPREKWTGYVYNLSESEECPNTVTTSNCWGPIGWEPDNGDSCLWAPIFFKCNGGNNQTFMAYVGDYGSSSWQTDWGASTQYSAYTGYSYLKVGDFVCGEYAMVGIEENQRPKFSIYPNPTNGVFQMQLSDWNGAKDFSVTVYDMLGRMVENLNPQTSTIEIDASAWPNGFYSVSLINERSAQYSERLVVQH